MMRNPNHTTKSIEYSFKYIFSPIEIWKIKVRLTLIVMLLEQPIKINSMHLHLHLMR